MSDVPVRDRPTIEAERLPRLVLDAVHRNPWSRPIALAVTIGREQGCYCKTRAVEDALRDLVRLGVIRQGTEQRPPSKGNPSNGRARAVYGPA